MNVMNIIQIFLVTLKKGILLKRTSEYSVGIVLSYAYPLSILKRRHTGVEDSYIYRLHTSGRTVDMDKFSHNLVQNSPIYKL